MLKNETRAMSMPNNVPIIISLKKCSPTLTRSKAIHTGTTKGTTKNKSIFQKPPVRVNVPEINERVNRTKSQDAHMRDVWPLGKDCMSWREI